jgi:hypothetical protein
MKEKVIETDGFKLLLDPLKLFGIIGCDGVPNHRGTFQLEPD